MFVFQNYEIRENFQLYNIRHDSHLNFRRAIEYVLDISDFDKRQSTVCYKNLR